MTGVGEGLRPLDGRAALDVESAETAGHAPGMLQWSVAALLVLAGAALLAVTAIGAYLYAPMADVIDWTARVFEAERSRDWLGYLWDPHTAQRIPLARLTEALDIEAARGRWPSFLIAGAIAWTCGCAALAGLLTRAKVSPQGRLWLGIVVGLVATNVGLAEDFAFPVFSVYLMVAGPALAAACLLQMAPRDGLRSASFWAALIFATLAGGGNAAGLAIWPALLAGAAVQGRGRPQLLAIMITGVAVCVLIEAGLGAPSSSLGREAGSAGAHVVKMLTYFCIFGGLPWTRASHVFPVVAAVGAIFWVAAGYALTRARPRQEDAASALAGAGVVLIVFGLIAAALATVGRVDELPAPIVPTRYTPFATLMQIGILLALAREVEGAVRTGWLERSVLALLAVFVLYNDIHGSRVLLRAAHRIRAASDAFDRTGQQGDVVIYPLPARAVAVRSTLAARGLPH